jgi:hypothetical protein
MKSNLRTLTLAVTLVTLTGCAAIQDRVANFYLSRWDAHESALVAEVSLHARDTLKICDPATEKARQVEATGAVSRSAHHLLAYSRTLPDDNRPVITVAKNIADSADEFHKRAQDKMSRIYCENKATNLMTMSEQAQRVVQAKRK